MKYDEFINTVMDRANLGTEDEALRAIEATLKTLGERITDDEAYHLAAQLPPEVGRFLTVVDNQKDFDLETFYEHVSQRMSIGQPMARENARAVISVVEDTVTPGELQDVFSQLPDEYLTLFTYGSDWRKLEGGK